MKQTVLVTGGSGYVACRLVKQLLEAGDTVHATVRSLHDSPKLRPLRQLQADHPDRLRLFEADLLVPGSFADAMQGCSVVHHVASPFLMPEKIKNGRTQLLEPALQGVRNVLTTVNATSSIERVVLTSTIGAIFGDYRDVLDMPGQTLSEAFFNTTSSLDHNPYHYSKVVAEQEAWAMYRAQQRWDLVCINPGLVLGPSPAAGSDSGSLFLLDELMRGLFFYGVPDLSFATVDVREVANAHIAAAKRPSAHGRYIVASAQMISFLEIARFLRKVHRRPYLLPRLQIPGLALRLLGPFFGLSPKYIRNHLGIRFGLDNRRSRQELGVDYRPVEQTLHAHYASWDRQRRA
ncbi:NAD-dependent epimerase/dehydratase family protein [Xanthomonas euvesicatoria]|uniref:NAD-dependent epimerase/dehydratase family protein n=1 Tax=Xanthomonas euvesicatoria TaxID=456327 RepID=UPI002457A018|nr:NAD-dependent epimerase/dehydratase family protein [Xanthomonas euvesicatoria]MDH4907982.1 NAD-dependent epimerase/dehydratase family protein [Xanthomonas euvesicatoria]